MIQTKSIDSVATTSGGFLGGVKAGCLNTLPKKIPGVRKALERCEDRYSGRDNYGTGKGLAEVAMTAGYVYLAASVAFAGYTILQ